VEQIQAELNRRILTTPIEGTVVELTKDIAEPVSSNMQQDYLVRVVQLDRLKCIGHLSAASTRTLKTGDVMQVRIEDGEVLTVSGTVEYVSPIINPATSTVQIRLVIPNEDRMLRSGATAFILVPRDS
jgi:multidrug efflux pump subunit AcrA (membrane-fusion protein)